MAFHSTALLLVVVFTFGLLIASKAGLAGIPLALLLVSWFFKYCFVMLDAAIGGREEPPVLSIEMVNPFDEQRPLGQAALIALGVMAVLAAKAYVGPVAAYLAGGALIFALPATVAALGLSDNFFLAAWPPRWIQIIRALRWDYVALNAVSLVSFGVVLLLARADAPSWLGVAVLQLAILLIFALIGGTVFEHRMELGLDSRSPAELREERDRREHDSARQYAIDHAYQQFRHGKPVDGWREIEAWLTVHAVADRRLNEYHAVLDAASVWDDVRPGDRLANELIALLLAQRQTGAALEVTQARIASNPRFRPLQALRLAELAALAGKRSLRRQLESPL